jgi:hypothetical protein
MKKCRTEFRDNFEMIRFRINRCRCDYRKTKRKVRGTVRSGPESDENSAFVRIPAEPSISVGLPVLLCGRHMGDNISPRRPGFNPSSGHVGFAVIKWHWGRFSPSTSVSPANSHSTECSIFIYHEGLV